MRFPNSYYKDLEDRISKKLNAIKAKHPTIDYRDTESYLVHVEYGLALTQLINLIDEENIHISKSDFNQIIKVASIMKSENEGYDSVKIRTLLNEKIL